MKQEFAQEIKNVVNDIVRDVHTAVPCKIVSFDPDKCEASVQPTAKFRKPDGSTIDFPQVHEVPVYFPQSAMQGITFVYHIKPDDEGHLHIMEQALDQWRTGAETDTELKFDMQNAVFVPGLFAKYNPLVKRAHENESIIIQRDDSYVELYGTTGQIDIYATGDINAETEKNMNITVAQNLTAKIGQNADVTVGQNATVDVGQNLDITVNGNTNIKSTGPITITSDDSITLTAPRIDLNP